MPVSNRSWGRSGRTAVAETPSRAGAVVGKPMVKCRASPWKWWHLGRSVLTRPSLKLIIGTKAFYMNIGIWCSKPPSFATSCLWICRFLILKAKFHVRVVVMWWAVTGSDNYCFIWALFCAAHGGQAAQTSAPSIDHLSFVKQWMMTNLQLQAVAVTGSS